MEVELKGLSLYDGNWECLMCEGGRRNGRGDGPCKDCGGTGRELTPLGKEIVQLLFEDYGLRPRR